MDWDASSPELHNLLVALAAGLRAAVTLDDFASATSKPTNRYLSAEQLAQATAIPAALAAAKALAQAGVTDAARLRDAAQAVLAAQPALKPQYCEIVDLETMAPVAATSGLRCAIAIACHLGATRLIDNADL